MLLFWSLLSSCLTSHRLNPSVWIKWSSMAQILTSAFSVTPSALSSVVRPDVALCTLLSISVFSGEFQATLSPASFHSSTLLPQRPSPRQLCVIPYVCPHVLAFMWWAQRPGPCPPRWMCGGSVAVPRVLGGQLKHRWSPASLLPTVAAALNPIPGAPQNTPQ